MDQSFFAIIPLFFILIFAAFGLAAFALWIWMLVDCLTKEPSEGNDKIVWVLVIVFLNWLGALIYWIVRRPQRIKQYGR